MISRFVLALLLTCCSLVASAQYNAPVRYLSGLEPDKFSTNKLNINPGSVAEFYGKELFQFPFETQIDLTKQGLWGIDKGFVVDGGELYVYVAWNPATSDYALVASQSTFQGGVVLPAGYLVARKLPWGVMYRSQWDGIPNFHLTNWPMPDIRFTDAEYSAKWMVLAAGISPTWRTLDLSAWLPDNARMAYIQVETRYIPGGSAGSSYIRSYGGQTTGLLVGSVNPGSEFSNGGALNIRVDSLRRMEYRVDPGAMLFIRVLGYSMTEPS